MSDAVELAAPAVTACYVYGVVPSATELPEGLAGVGDPAGEVSLVPYDDVAALVSEYDPDRPAGTRRDLLAHETVLDTVALQEPTLPMRFGAVLSDTDAVLEDLLAPHHPHFAEVLTELDGHVQFTVKGRYVEEPVLAEVLAEEPEVARLRERTQQLPDDAGYYDRIRLGELVVHALGRKRDADGQLLVDTLGPHATAVSAHEPGGEQEVANTAFLVPHGRRAWFEDAVEDLARQWAGRVRLRLLGPLAPYDFVGEAQE